MPRFLTAALYKFVDLPDFAALRDPLLAVCEAHQVKGTLLLAREGINGTIAGPEAGVRAVLAFLHADPRLATLGHKASWSDKPPFLRMKVRLKKEIVTLGVPELDPSRTVGQYVKPQDWNALLADPDVLVIDTRNDYEVAIGSFKGAINPDIKTFTELPAWLDAQPALQDGRKPKVAMFCTGGIRCEKSTALMKMRGFDEVYHLEGGILKYLEEVPPEQSTWEGECFVFDERVSVGHGLRPGPHELCRSCRWPLGEAEKASPLYVKGVSCPHCHDLRSPKEKARLAERQRQVELAEVRGELHVGARMPSHDD
ncbi:MAG: rhodanese-related sulfurtransferase [Hydrogenophaga sp.]|uniref:oxygen-dependent tRNA uridine(34) hydroxylase TrhO n=1 Tax=Hydrogenophaga sp. TaxID=1904254 RepID=UPI0025C5C730|nr:rhodanese-related sulfurtransferase [Hydrogenophaga sp.]MBT9553828.1 rhodanese-related sulfurtransferase [Hydrogenophaga sp.]